MTAKVLVMLATLAASGLSGAAQAANATAPGAMVQPDRSSDMSAQKRRLRAPPRIEVYPGRLLYRQCASWYAIELRYSGPTIVPRQRCRWVRG